MLVPPTATVMSVSAGSSVSLDQPLKNANDVVDQDNLYNIFIEFTWVNWLLYITYMYELISLFRIICRQPHATINQSTLAASLSQQRAT